MIELGQRDLMALRFSSFQLKTAESPSPIWRGCNENFCSAKYDVHRL